MVESAVTEYFPLAETLDAVGPITRTVDDACIILEAIAGEDERGSNFVADFRSQLSSRAAG